MRWSVAHHSLRKRVALALYQRRDLESAAILFATSEIEAMDIRMFGLRQPIAIVPNAVEIPILDFVRPAGVSSQRIALYIGRLHQKKGIHDLISAWAAQRPSGWRLHIAGPEEGTYGDEMRALVERSRLANDVTFVGPVNDDEKWALYKAARVFISPTYSENFGMTIAEAMAAGLPVLTTTGAPWQVLESERAGWWVAPGAKSIGEALESALACTEFELATMGARGKSYVTRELTWEGVARKALAAYEWILLGRSRPDHVQI